MSVNTPSLRTGAKIVERAGNPIAADQMRAAADEIERLRQMCGDYRLLGDAHVEAMKRVSARRAELEKALEPFARDGAEIGKGVPDDTVLEYNGFPDLGVTDFTVGDLRRAAASIRSMDV